MLLGFVHVVGVHISVEPVLVTLSVFCGKSYINFTVGGLVAWSQQLNQCLTGWQPNQLDGKPLGLLRSLPAKRDLEP